MARAIRSGGMAHTERWAVVLATRMLLERATSQRVKQEKLEEALWRDTDDDRAVCEALGNRPLDLHVIRLIDDDTAAAYQYSPQADELVLAS